MYSFRSATFPMAAGGAAHRQEGRKAGGARPARSSGGVGGDSEQARHVLSSLQDSHTQPLDPWEYQLLLKSLNSSDGGITILCFSQQFFIKTTAVHIEMKKGLKLNNPLECRVPKNSKEK